jgi:signal transduction histidine kinase
VVLLKESSRSGRLEQNLRQLDRLASVGTLSASMAHEVKNALVAIKTFIDLLLERNQDSELAGTVRREMGRMDAIVCHMLKFAAPAQPSFVPVHLHDILDHSLRVAQLRVGGKAITFQRTFRASPDFFTGDDHQLEQAFANLLLNAVEAIGTEGSLTVATDRVSDETSFRFREAPAVGEFLRVKITDSGGGISAQLLPRIFDPFFTTKQSGTGLGLAVTRRIIEEHGGMIRVESRPDQGTTFTILLPTARS